MRKHVAILTSLGLPLLLAACGGASSSNTKSAAEGAWTGSDSWGNSFSMVVLENGDYYSLYGANKPEGFQLQGFDQGTPTLSGDSLKGPLTEFDNNKPAKGTLEATVVAGSTIQGSITNVAGTSTGTFSATPRSAKYPAYDYNATANASDVQGNWTVTSLNSNAEKITINDKGVVTGSIKGCSFSGTVTPRSTGKNVLNMDLLFGPSLCEYVNQGVSGIALDYDLGNGKRQLLVALQDPIKGHGYSFSAQR